MCFLESVWHGRLRAHLGVSGLSGSLQVGGGKSVSEGAAQVAEAGGSVVTPIPSSSEAGFIGSEN